MSVFNRSTYMYVTLLYSVWFFFPALLMNQVPSPMWWKRRILASLEQRITKSYVGITGNYFLIYSDCVLLSLWYYSRTFFKIWLSFLLQTTDISRWKVTLTRRATSFLTGLYLLGDTYSSSSLMWNEVTKWMRWPRLQLNGASLMAI